MKELLEKARPLIFFLIIVRVLLAGVLLCFVYGETGWATTLALSLIYVNTEATDLWVSILAKRWGGLHENH